MGSASEPRNEIQYYMNNDSGEASSRYPEEGRRQSIESYNSDYSGECCLLGSAGGNLVHCQKKEVTCREIQLTCSFSLFSSKVGKFLIHGSGIRITMIRGFIAL
jgi:hypothetical protein